MASLKATQVIDVMREIFPHGYADYALYKDQLAAAAKKSKIPTKRHKSFDNPPCSAVDLFALAGQLLMKSGAYHHVGPDVAGADAKAMIIVTRAMRDEWQRIGALWRGTAGKTLPAPPPELLALWNDLQSYRTESAFRSPGYTTLARNWWTAAIALFCIADEAAINIGFETGDAKTAQADYIELPIRERQRRATTREGRRGPMTLSKANVDVACVLPKSRTPKVGCTIRSLSHNLALLPGRGLAHARWSLTPTSDLVTQEVNPKPFNLVILPIPFQIRSSAFKGVPSDEGSWGWFDVAPHWCPASADDLSAPPGMAEFAKFVSEVLDRAERDSGRIHGLVLPEVALSYAAFRGLCEHLQDRDGFELLISGLFDGPMPVGPALRSGNFTGMARFTQTGKRTFDTSIREKHHRWRIEKSQIETYALGAALDVNRGWWEHIDILQRSLDVFVLRGGATVTTLICEDLARNDPCQELVRGIGPNFVVALLMDGPQMKDRWPARYATVLADDPGSSVLSVTSFGLIDRTNKTGAYPPANQIALFRDDTGRATEIRLPAGAQAVCITLQPTKMTERTLDGRDDKQDAQSWRLSAVQPVSIESPDAHVVKGNWPPAA